MNVHLSLSGMLHFSVTKERVKLVFHGADGEVRQILHEGETEAFNPIFLMLMKAAKHREAHGLDVCCWDADSMSRQRGLTVGSKISEWVKCSDQLPEPEKVDNDCSDQVLIYQICCGPHIVKAVYSQSLQSWYDNDDYLLGGEITHWMPLPSPPAE